MSRRRAVEKWKTKSRFSTFPLVVLSLSDPSERRPGGGSLRSRLQAHSWMRKCWTQQCYVAAVRQLAEHYHTSPDRLTEEWPTLRFLRPPRQRKLPVVLSREEVRRALAAVRSPGICR
jgi:integrase